MTNYYADKMARENSKIYVKIKKFRQSERNYGILIQECYLVFESCKTAKEINNLIKFLLTKS